MKVSMDSLTLVSSLAAGILVLIVTIFVKKKRSSSLGLPAGPPGWPIIGNIFQLGDNPQQSLFQLAQRYGPLMTIKLGMQRAVVASSPSMAKEVLKHNDISSRTLNTAVKVLFYQGTSVICSPYGHDWRFLRKICTTELFSAKRLDALQNLRGEELFRTIESIREDCKQGNSVNIGEKTFMMSLNIMGRMICGKKLFEAGSAQAAEFRSMVREALHLSGMPNLSDTFPFLGRFDLQGVASKAKTLAQRFDNIFNMVIEERVAQRTAIPPNGNGEKDFVDVMLDLREDGTQITLENIKAVMMDMFFAGIDTTSKTIERTIAELMRNPTIMEKVQEELDNVVGVEKRMKEEDIANLPYLRAVVKEVLRIHPLAPLIGRISDIPCEVGGFFVPKNMQVLVNAWAIGRDPSVWKDPLNFNPDRFLKCEIDYKGHDFELVPFGSGRRICLGLPLAHRMVHLVLGSLLQAFSWSIPTQNKENIYKYECFSLTIQKGVPFIAIPISRDDVKF